MLGGLISDLEIGDEFAPVSYTLTALITSEYAHGVEEPLEWFYSAASPWGRQVCMPTLVHADKMRILEVNCPDEARLAGMKGPAARIHYEYHVRHHSPAFVGDELVVGGRIKDRYERRGRTYLLYEFEIRTRDGRLITQYWDRTVLKYQQDDAQ
jgi:hypothetical protein